MSSPIDSPPPLPSSRSSPSSFDSEESLELSFDYEIDADGKLVRVSKGSNKPSTSAPPTPPKTLELPAEPEASSSVRRASLSRSESLPGAGLGQSTTSTDTLLAPPRTLTRTSSGPVNTTSPAQTTRGVGVASLTSGLYGTGRKTGPAQRIRKEEAERQRREIEERIRREEEEAERERARRALEEKENMYSEMRQSPPQASRPIAALPSRQNQFGFPRVTRPLVSAKKLPTVSRIHESEQAEREVEEADNYVQPQYYQHRTAADTNGDPYSYLPTSRSLPSQYAPLPSSRPNSLHGFPSRARRVTAEERMRQEQEIAEEQALAEAAAEAAELQSRKSPSPPHASHSRHGLHQRRDSDTLRSGLPYSYHSKRDDLAFDQQHRLSPTSRSLGGTTAVQPTVRQQRSPSAPEKPTTTMKATIEHAEQHVQSNGKSHSSGTGQRSHLQQAMIDLKMRPMTVGKKVYYRLDLIGKGGSSRVFRVVSTSNEIYAIKRVSLEKSDEDTVGGYLNEIALLKRLDGNKRIIRIIEHEVKNVGTSKGSIQIVMECGEIDLARLCQVHQREPMNTLWIAYYWQQMLEAVHVIHEEKIIHSDLKPANFVLVRGQLKLIDFGIAKAIANDTTNIQREHQIGTVNYMSPEAIEMPEGMRKLKLGRSSDVWSLGCILYQMVYGHAPFAHLTVFQKMKAIPDKNYIIEFPEESVPEIPSPRSASGAASAPPTRLTHLATPVRKDVIETMQRCLQRDPKERALIPELLDDDWLSMREPPPPPPPREPTPPPPPPREPTPKQEELVLAHDEAIINHEYMRQLIRFVVHRAKDAGGVLTEREITTDAENLVAELQNITTRTRQ